MNPNYNKGHRSINRQYARIVLRKTRYLLTLILLAKLNSALAQSSIIIQDVNIVDVTSGKVIPHQNVFIRDSIIESISDIQRSSINLTNAAVIDGKGKYLMPGMVDAHIHFFQTGGLYTRPDVVDFQNIVPYAKEVALAQRLIPDHLRRYLRMGITTVVDVGGPFYNFTVRDSVAQRTPSPNVLVTGPLFSTYQPQALTNNDPPIVRVSSIAAINSLLDRMLPHQPDLIKVWYIVTPDQTASQTFSLVSHLGKRAQVEGIPLAVHATERHTAMLAVEAGANILVHSVTDSIVSQDFVELLKERKVTYVPTLIVDQGYQKVLLSDTTHHPQDLFWANAQSYSSHFDLQRYDTVSVPTSLVRLRENPTAYQRLIRRQDSVMTINLRKMVEAGVNIAVGTDAGNIGTMHASSYVQELEALRRVGMSTADILRAATLSGVKSFSLEDKLGSVTEGKIADLVLLRLNPLAALENINTAQYIIKAGMLIKLDTLVRESPEEVVQRQLNAYNARDIDAFMATYADSAEIYNYPNELMIQGREQMNEQYTGLFKNVPNLYAEVKNRIVMGNKVIDQERARAGEQYIDAVAIYEVTNGKITRVTFIRE